MNINSVSANSNITYAQGDTSIVRTLEKQKLQLQDQIQKVKESKMDSKLKQETVDQLTEQISQIDAQIKQEQMKKLTPEASKDDSENSSTDKQQDETDGQNNSGGISSKYMVSAVSGYSDLKTMGKVRTQLKGDLRIATNSGENPAAGMGIQNKLQKLEGDMLEKTKQINNDLKKAAKEVKAQKQDKEGAEESENTQDIKNNADTATGSVDNKADVQEDKSIASDKENSSEKNHNSVQSEGKVIDIRI